MEKKIFSVFMVVSMLLQLCVFGASANALTDKLDYTKEAPEKIQVPGGMNLILLEDHENYPDTISSTQWSVMMGVNTYISPVQIGENRALLFYNTDVKSHGPRLEKLLPKDLTKVYFEFDYITGNTPLYVALTNKDNANRSNFTMFGTESGPEWSHVKISLDLRKKTADVECNGEMHARQVDISSVDQTQDMYIRINSNILPEGRTLFDNFMIYTPDELGEMLVHYDGTFNYGAVRPDKPIDQNSFVKNLKPHPRLLVHDWDEIKAKIETDYYAAQWYSKIKMAADAALEAEVYTYNLNDRNNLAGVAGSIATRIENLAFTYKITGEQKYLDRFYAEILATAEFPNWAPDSFLAPAEMMFGMACAYDWCYYDLSDTQKARIVEIIKTFGLPNAILMYEDQGTGTNFKKTDSNWNSVCNGSVTGVAVALADEAPEICEYLLERTPVYLNTPLAPYAPQGGFPEGVNYWNYGTTYLILAADILENAFVDGYKLPENYILSNAPGISETGEFPVYYVGPQGGFNYGDAKVAFVNSAALHWLANRFDKPYLSQWSLDMQEYTNSQLSAGYQAIAAIAWYDSDNAYSQKGDLKLDKVYSSDANVNGMSMRSTWAHENALFVALQGGDNKANHQYLSLGNFVIDAYGERFVELISENNYSLPGYFEKGANNSRRYQYYNTRAEGNNTFIANPGIEADQEATAFAKLVYSGSSPSTAFGILDMTQTNAAFTDTKRGVMLADGRSKVIVQDEIETNAPSEIWWFTHTPAEITLSADGKHALLENNGKQMLVRIAEGPADATFSIMDRKPLPTSPQPTGDIKHSGYKLAISMKNVTKTTLKVEFIPLDALESVPEKTPLIPLAQWTAADGSVAARNAIGKDVALLVGSSKAIANGKNTYVDVSNTEVVPIVENGRTLVPVRFISESFGAKVSWTAETKTVGVQLRDKNIQLQIGSDQMFVNGNAVTLDVPAQVVNSRTLIPLRALVEALGKQVFWDARGLIIISDNAIAYDADTVTQMIDQLGVQVTLGGQPLDFFEAGKTQYFLKETEQKKTLNCSTILPSQSATLAWADEHTAVLTLRTDAGEAQYTFRFTADVFEGLKSNMDDGVVQSVRIRPTEVEFTQDYILVQKVTASAFGQYPERGTVDGIINDKIENRWSMEGEQWLCYDFGKVTDIGAFAIGVMNGQTRSYKYDLELSEDGINWTKVIADGATEKTAAPMQLIDLGRTYHARYVRITGKGSNEGGWNSYSELRFYVSMQQGRQDAASWSVQFNQNAFSGKVGDALQVLAEGEDAKHNIFALPESATVRYSIDKPEIASVDASGRLTLLAAGTASLQVTAEVDGKTFTAEAEITVE